MIKKIKKIPLFRINNDTVTARRFAFLSLSVFNIKLFLFISVDLLSRDLDSFLCIHSFNITLKVFSLF